MASFGDGRESARLGRVIPDFPLLPDLTEAASDFSGASPFEMRAEFLGLSVFPAPGIFDFKAPRKDRDDSFVSDLLNEGYDCSPSPALLAPDDLGSLSPLEGWLPMSSRKSERQGTLSALKKEKARGWTACASQVCGPAEMPLDCPHSLPLHPSRNVDVELDSPLLY